MIITKEQLQKIIKEELQEVLKWAGRKIVTPKGARKYARNIKKLDPEAPRYPKNIGSGAKAGKIRRKWLLDKIDNEWSKLSPEMQQIFIKELGEIAGEKRAAKWVKNLKPSVKTPTVPSKSVKEPTVPGAEETPTEETPTEETPAEETPAEETPAEETPTEEVVAPFNSEDEYTASTHRQIFKGTINAYKAMNKEPDSVEGILKRFQEHFVKEKSTFLKKFTKTKFLIQKKIINTYAEDLKKINSHIRSALLRRRAHHSASKKSAVMKSPTAEQMRAEEQLVHSLEELHKQLKKINLESARKVAKGAKWKTTHV